MNSARLHTVYLTVAIALSAQIAMAQSPLSFDEPWDCQSDNAVANGEDKTEGEASVQYQSSGYSLCESPAMTCESFDFLSEEILVDVKLPEEVPNPYWIGDVSLFIEIPSAGIYNQWIGNALLNDLELNEWSTVSIAMPLSILYALDGTCDDVVVRFALNTSASDVLVDNIRFAGDEPPVELVMTITDDADDGQFDPSTSVISSGWSINGERNGYLYTGSYKISNWGGLGNGLTTSAYRFTLPDAISADAEIADAWLSFYGVTTWNWQNDVNALQIAVEISEDAEQIAGLEDMPLTDGGREIASTTIRWPEVGGLEWLRSDWNDSVNIAPLIEELLDTVGGLEAGAHLQFFVYGDVADINREVVIADSSHTSGNAPILTIVVD